MEIELLDIIMVQFYDKIQSLNFFEKNNTILYNFINHEPKLLVLFSVRLNMVHEINVQTIYKKNH